MGRLFWKLFLAFLAALALSGLLVAFVLSVIHPRDRGQFGGPPPPGFMADSVAAVLRSSGVAAVRPVLSAWQAQHLPVPLVVGPDGSDLLGREVGQQQGGARIVTIDGADWRVIEPGRGGAPPSANGAPGVSPPGMPLPPPPFLEVVTGVLGALAFSAVLAWYLSRPVRHLHRAFDALARGDLDARVRPLIGAQRDEIADLGLGFDRMAGRIQHLLDAQRRLLHDVSHELRSPLARMSAAIGLARQDPARSEAMLDRVEHEAARLDTLIGELLGLSRLEDEARRAPSEPVDLAALLRDIVDDARFEAQARGVEVAADAGCAGPLWVDAHAALLHRAFDNILRNAVKYSPAGSRVQVGLDVDDDRARVVVSDQGCGVAADELECIFDPFVRGGRGQAEPGSGLGLSIARRAIEAHGGAICATSPTTGGLRVTIRLPLPA